MPGTTETGAISVAAIPTPVTFTVDCPAVARTVAVVMLLHVPPTPFGVAIIKPAGKLSMKLILETAGLLMGLVMVNVRRAIPASLMLVMAVPLALVNALVRVGN